MDAHQIVVVALLLTVCSMLQSAIGFGRALFAIPIMLWIGLPLQDAIAISVTSGIAQMVMSAFHLRRDLELRSLTPLIISAVAALPIGGMVLSRIAALGKDTAGQCVGVIILVIMACQWLFRVQPRERLHPGWDYAAFISYGTLFGMSGVGGPLIAIWAMAHNWSGRRIRGTILAVFAVVTPFLGVSLYVAFGQSVILPLLLGVAFLPFVIIGSAAGLWIGNRIGRNRLLQISWGLLLLLSLRLILAPVL